MDSPAGGIAPNDEDPFKGSSRTMRSPRPTPCAPNPADTAPTTTLGNVAINESSTFEQLGEKIRALSQMLIGRRSIHQPMRDLVDNILGLYVAADEEQSHLTSTKKKATPPTQRCSPREGKRSRDERGEPSPPLPGPKKPKGKTAAIPTAAIALKPADIAKEKTPRQDEVPWKNVENEKSRRKPIKSDAIVVKGKEGVSYAEILRSVKTEPKLKSLAQQVKGIRKTAKGELLFELKRSADPNTRTFQEAVQTFLGPETEVRSLTEMGTLEVKDLDEVTTTEELLEALITQFGEIGASPSSIISIRKSYGGTQTATVKLHADKAEKLAKEGKVRVGWVICRIRRKTQPMRCFKCMEFGHIASRCTGEDCTGLCFKCGEKGHKARSCHNKWNCILCARKGEKDTDHSANSSRCPYMAAAQARRSQQ